MILGGNLEFDDFGLMSLAEKTANLRFLKSLVMQEVFGRQFFRDDALIFFNKELKKLRLLEKLYIQFYECNYIKGKVFHEMRVVEISDKYRSIPLNCSIELGRCGYLTTLAPSKVILFTNSTIWHKLRIGDISKILLKIILFWLF